MVLRIELYGERRLEYLTTSVKMIFGVNTYKDMDVSVFVSAANPQN